MKKLAILSLTILSLTTFAQDKQANDSASQPVVIKEVINRSFTFENGKVMLGKKMHGLNFIYTGNIKNLIKRLATDLGKAHIIYEDLYMRKVVFKNIENPDWSDKKLILGLHAFSNVDKHSIGITCLDKNGNDYLIPGTESEKKITAFLEAKLKAD